MLKTLEGTYKHGQVQLNEKPAGIDEANVLVTFLPSESTPLKKGIEFGMFKGNRQTTLDDFKGAEWHGGDDGMGT